MQPQTMSASVFEGDSESVGNYRGWLIFAGITSMVLGTIAIVYDVSATLASVFLFGWLLMLAGFMQIVHAFQVRTWSGFFLYLLDGIIRATVGTLLVMYPGSGALTLTRDQVLAGWHSPARWHRGSSADARVQRLTA